MNKYQQKHTVTLSSRERKQLEDITRRGKHNGRVLRRAMALVRSGGGETDASIADGVGVSIRTIERIRAVFADKGLKTALYDLPRPGRPRKLGEKAEKYLVATACTEPPEGAHHWTLELLAEQMVKDKQVQSISSVAIMHYLHRNDIKPWREKNVVRTQAYAGVH